MPPSQSQLLRLLLLLQPPHLRHRPLLLLRLLNQLLQSLLLQLQPHQLLLPLLLLQPHQLLLPLLLLQLLQQSLLSLPCQPLLLLPQQHLPLTLLRSLDLEAVTTQLGSYPQGCGPFCVCISPMRDGRDSASGPSRLAG